MSVSGMRAYLGDGYVGRVIGAKAGLGGPSAFVRGTNLDHVSMSAFCSLSLWGLLSTTEFLCQGPLASAGEELGVNY